MSLSNPKSTGTKLFSVCGNVQRPGTYEVVMGFPFKEFLYDLCGGPLHGRKFKAVIPGGASVPIQTMEEAEATLMDYEGFVAQGSMLGSGGVIVFDDAQSMVRVIARLARFYAHESCAQCTQCREGTAWTTKILERIRRRRGHDGRPRHAARDLGEHDRQDDLRAERFVRGAGRLGNQEVPERVRGADPGQALSPVRRRWRDGREEDGEPDDRRAAGQRPRRARRFSRRRRPPACSSRTTAITPGFRSRACAACASSKSRRRPSSPRVRDDGRRRPGRARSHERALDARKGVLEMLLINHPLDCPDLRSVRRVRAAGLHLPGRPRGFALPRAQALQSRRGFRRRRDLRPEPLHPLHALRPVHGRRRARSGPQRQRARRPRADREVRGEGSDASVGRQRRRSVSGRRAPLQGLPEQGARVGARPHRVHLPELHAGVQHHDRDARHTWSCV